MMTALSKEETLDRFFLEMRSRTLDLAAALDRVDAAALRSRGAGADDARLAKLREALRVLAEVERDRAERVQMIFSDEYDPAWRSGSRAG